MDRIEPFVLCERRSDLLRRRRAVVEHNRLNFGAHVADHRLQVGDRGIDKKNFRGTGHDWLPWLRTQFKRKPPTGLAGDGSG
ncbi:hypothetical protein [Mesorhizobium sp. M8A.F.Ca.ET.057.01.1.1]|uniref:hypothetical protein n=1 Tax=Mesorhizobium sp. M8A.F.Ca.ET.057.01.1.1 TaxID=2493679 RepID=UPI001ABF0378|nr:hypothetical protein [Mesorhizobium sp. M8A.F.Ca.ET.057.01.1.1]